MQGKYAVTILALTFALSVPMRLFAQEAIKTPDQLIREAKAQIKEVSVEETKKMIDSKEKGIFLDVRDKEEYDRGHLPGAIHMSRGALDFHVHEIIPNKNAKIVAI